MSVSNDLSVDNTNISESFQIPRHSISLVNTIPDGYLFLDTDKQLYYTFDRDRIAIEGNGAIVCNTQTVSSPLSLNKLYIAIGDPDNFGLAAAFTMTPFEVWEDREIFLFNNNGGAHTITVNDTFVGIAGTGTTLTFPNVYGSSVQIYATACNGSNQYQVIVKNGAGFTIA